MNNKCNDCAKFLTCNRKECKKITFVEAEILERPKTIVKKDWEQQISELNTEAEKSFRAIANGMKEVGTSLEEYLKRLNKNNQGIEDKLIIGYDQASGRNIQQINKTSGHRKWHNIGGKNRKEPIRPFSKIHYKIFNFFCTR